MFQFLFHIQRNFIATFSLLIMRGEDQLSSEVIIVYFFRKAHHAMGDKFIRRGFSQYIRLHLMKNAHQIGAEPFPIQQL